MTETVPARELAKHNTAENAWIVIDGDVYDVSKFGTFEACSHSSHCLAKG